MKKSTSRVSWLDHLAAIMRAVTPAEVHNRTPVCTAAFLFRTMKKRYRSKALRIAFPNDFELRGTDGVWSPEIIRGINIVEMRVRGEPIINQETERTERLTRALCTIHLYNRQLAASLMFLGGEQGYVPQRQFSVNRAKYLRAIHARTRIRQLFRNEFGRARRAVLT